MKGRSKIAFLLYLLGSLFSSLYLITLIRSTGWTPAAALFADTPWSNLTPDVQSLIQVYIWSAGAFLFTAVFLSLLVLFCAFAKRQNWSRYALTLPALVGNSLLIYSFFQMGIQGKLPIESVAPLYIATIVVILAFFLSAGLSKEQ